MKKLTRDHLDELSALELTNDTYGKSPLMRHHWHSSGYQSLVRRGLVMWGDPPKGFRSRHFAGAEITEAGRDALRKEEQMNG